MSVVRCKLSKLDERLDTAVKDKKFYEAHQLYKTVYYRCLTKRNYLEAVRYLIAGAEFLLDHNQWESGTELACLILDVYTKAKMALGQEHFDQLCFLLVRMSPGDERLNFVNKAVQFWTSTNKDFLAKFNGYLARILWQEGSFTDARFRIMLSFNGFATGTFLIALHQRFGLKSEIDLFIVQAVLQFLCMRQISVAILTFYTYTRNHPYLQPGPPYTHFPLLNFVWFLMLAIGRKCGLNVFSVLCEKYSTQLNRDLTYMKYLDKIGQMYFGLKPPEDKANNILSQFMQMFNGGETAAGTSSNIENLLKSEIKDVMSFEDVD